MKTECQKPTKRYPNGRSGTSAGLSAHSRVKEENCETCAEFKREADRLRREKQREADRRYREKHAVKLKAKNKDKKREYYEKNAEAIREKSRKYYHENKEKAKASRLEYRKNNLEKYRANRRAYSREYRKNNPEKYRAAITKWHEENAEYVKEQAAKYREENRDAIRARNKEYCRKNSEKREGYSRKRRALKASQPHEPYTREEVVELHGTVCYLCGGEVDMSLSWGNDRSPAMDHKWPLNVPGGPGDVLSNMWVTHSVCNIRKGDRMVETLTLPFAEPESREWSSATIDSELV